MKIILLIILGSFLMSATKGCSIVKEGDYVGNIYPSQGVGRVRQVSQVCPLKTTAGANLPLDSRFDGWCIVPPDKCADYKTEYNSKCD